MMDVIDVQLLFIGRKKAQKAHKIYFSKAKGARVQNSTGRRAVVPRVRLKAGMHGTPPGTAIQGRTDRPNLNRDFFRWLETRAKRMRIEFRQLWRSDVVVWPPEQWGLHQEKDERKSNEFFQAEE